MLTGFDTDEFGPLAFSRARDITSKDMTIDGIQPEIVNRIIDGQFDEATERKNQISISRLIGCLRGAYYENTTDFYEKLTDLYYSFRGQMIHSLLEKGQSDGVISEKRFFMELGGITITGRPDKFSPETGRLIDYKTCKEVPKYNSPYTNHKAQVLGYKLLLEKNGYAVNSIAVVYLDMECVKTCEVAKIPPSEEIEKEFLRKAKIFSDAIKSNIPPEIPEGYPLYWKCGNYCPKEIKERCAKDWRHAETQKAILKEKSKES